MQYYYFGDTLYFTESWWPRGRLLASVEVGKGWKWESATAK